MKKTILGLFVTGTALAQSSNSGDAIWNHKDDTNNDGNWSTKVANPGIGIESDPTKCPDDTDYTLISGTTAINGLPPRNDSQCWKISEAQECYNKLGLLDDIGYDGTDPYGDLRNDCRVREVEGEKYFDFVLSWTKDYEHVDNCVEQEVNFIEHDPNSTYVPGTSDPDTDNRLRISVPHATVPYAQDPANNDEYPHDVFYWNDVSNQIVFSIDFEDLVDVWKCHYIETTLDDGSEVYQWICDVELNVYFSGEIQYTYEFQSITTLDRTVSDTLDVTVQRNVVVGECCENTLDVVSELFFCSNFICTSNDANGAPIAIDSQNPNQIFEGAGSPGWINRGTDQNPDWIKQVERRQIFYVAHRINTADFQDDYFLQPISLHIGPFVPKIHNWRQIAHPVTGTSRASSNILVYKVESFVALDQLTISSVALLDDRTSTTLVDNDNDFPAGVEGYGGYDFNDANWDSSARRVRRALEDVGTDYKIKAEGSMGIVEAGQGSQTQQQQFVTEESSVILSLGMALFIVLALF